MSDPKVTSGAASAAELSLADALDHLARRAATLEASSILRNRVPIRQAGLQRSLISGLVSKKTFERARHAGLIEIVPGTGSYRLSSKGREAVRRLRSAGARSSITEPRATQPGRNEDESPLAWLRRRQGKSGTALIGEVQFSAGERLRADFYFAQMTPRVTSSWNTTFAAADARRGAPGMGVDLSDGAVAAAQRVHKALHAVGPELSGILVDVCCHLKGMEDLERSAGWPQRSAKVVLPLALTSLARHYGLMREEGPHPSVSVRHWGSEDYRPALGAVRDTAGATDQAEG